VPGIRIGWNIRLTVVGVGGTKPSPACDARGRTEKDPSQNFERVPQVSACFSFDIE
jgi:hypothetical protein